MRAKKWFMRRCAAAESRADAGMATAEYAMGAITACAFAAVLYKVVTSDMVRAALQSVIGKALHAQF
jgi:hypothetical protein